MTDAAIQNSGFPWLSGIVFLPILGILLLFAVGKSRDRAMKWIAFLVTGADFLLSLPLWFLFDRSVPGMQFAERTSWISVPPIQYSLGVDGISLPLVLMTTFLMPLCVMCSWTSIQTRVREYLAVLLVMETAMLG
ncbi:MAG: NADH-quinone oxidoreductase subunit M, partial [Nitrospira sp.]